MKFGITILLAIVLCKLSLHLSAQELPINSRFKGGKEGLIDFMSQNLKYPVKSREYKTIGYSISAITITPEGEIKNIAIINPLDEYIDNEIIKTLEKTKNEWIRSDSIKTDQTFYVQVIYQIVYLPENQPAVNFPIEDMYNFLEPVFITAASLKNEDQPENDELLGEKLSKYLKDNKYEDALRYADELIRRNPFNKEMYQLRIFINQKLKNNDLIAKDAQRIQNFIPGVSLDEFINTYSQATAEKDSLQTMNQNAESTEEKIYEKTEQMPEFPGGQEAMSKFISRNLKYPKSEAENGVQGMVIVRFVINKYGKVINPLIVKSVHPSLDKEALRVISLMPEWKPAIQDGKAVNVYFTLPFRFIRN